MTSQIDASTNIFRIDFDEEEAKENFASIRPENRFQTPRNEIELLEDNLMVEEEKFMPIS